MQAWKNHKGISHGSGNTNLLNKHISKIYSIMLPEPFFLVFTAYTVFKDSCFLITK